MKIIRISLGAIFAESHASYNACSSCMHSMPSSDAWLASISPCRYGKYHKRLRLIAYLRSRCFHNALCLFSLHICFLIVVDQVELQGIRSQLNELLGVYDDLQDRLYEIDRSWQNNLVFYGIKPDAGGVYENQDCLEHKVKAVLRNQLNIGRDIQIQRAQRIYNGSDVRGFKPVVVNFQVRFFCKKRKCHLYNFCEACKFFYNCSLQS